jgi:hypothetical protein
MMVQEVNLIVYPNPSSSQITVEIPTKPQKNTILTILDIKGQQQLSQQITEPLTVINISELSQGIYFVRLTNNSEVAVGKFVKQ